MLISCPKIFPTNWIQKNGEAVLIHSPPIDGIISVSNADERAKQEIKFDEYKKNYSKYAIIVKQLTNREKAERSGHWFFSAFRKSKWIYVQVMIAAMVSNFLSLTTALFTMTVYDRVIPNEHLNQ